MFFEQYQYFQQFQHYFFKMTKCYISIVSLYATSFLLRLSPFPLEHARSTILHLHLDDKNTYLIKLPHQQARTNIFKLFERNSSQNSVQFDISRLSSNVRDAQMVHIDLIQTLSPRRSYSLYQHVCLCYAYIA